MLEGFDSTGVDVKMLASELKFQLACGGTIGEESIELQDNHSKHIEPVLQKQGFTVTR